MQPFKFEGLRVGLRGRVFDYSLMFLKGCIPPPPWADRATRWADLLRERLGNQRARSSDLMNEQPCCQQARSSDLRYEQRSSQWIRLADLMAASGLTRQTCKYAVEEQRYDKYRKVVALGGGFRFDGLHPWEN